MNDSTLSEETLFANALARPAADRPAYLDQACAGHPALRARVEALLQTHEGELSLLEGSPRSAARTAMHRLNSEEQPGTMIGRYKLLQKIGEGGCGTVYMAEQQEPVVRRIEPAERVRPSIL